MENHFFNGKTHYKWPCSIAFCMFTRGYSRSHPGNMGTTMGYPGDGVVLRDSEDQLQVQLSDSKDVGIK